MQYSKEEIIQYIQEEDIKFIHLAFCNVFGKQKNISIMADELEKAFTYGIAIDASAIAGFGDESRSDLLLHPETDTLTILPWRPEHGRIVRMFCSISYPDGTPFPCDTRNLLKKAVKKAEEAGVQFFFGPEMEFYLFELDPHGQPTKVPYDTAEYMDIAPEDKCENIRREICLTLEQMGIFPESAHHEEGPGQNEIDFRYSDPLTSADNTLTFQAIVKTIAQRNGLYADFSPKPLSNYPGNGFHINISAKDKANNDLTPQIIASILQHIAEMTIFLNPTPGSYMRFGMHKAPRYITWSKENRSQLIRIPAAIDNHRRVELRSPDSTTNPYLAFTLLIDTVLEGIEKQFPLLPSTDLNLFTADAESLIHFKRLPQTIEEAALIAANSSFLAANLPEKIIQTYRQLSKEG